MGSPEKSCLLIAALLMLLGRCSADGRPPDKNGVGLISRDLLTIQDILWLSKNFKIPEEDEESFSSLIDGDDVSMFLDDNEIENEDFPFSGSVNKRDYTAGQLLDLLRQVAGSRGRHRQIGIAGKSLRFGIGRK